jgi:hypothetical protein
LQSVLLKSRFSTLAGLILALILPIFALAPLFYPGYLQTHSGLVPLWNVADLSAKLGCLSWTPHLATNFDPLRSDGLLPYYLAGLLPLSPAVAVKMVLGLGWLLGSLGMFLLLKSWLNHPGALVAAQVYTYLPYRIATVYVRGAWGEALFWGLLPWALLAAVYLTTFSKLSRSKLPPSTSPQKGENRPTSPRGGIEGGAAKSGNAVILFTLLIAAVFWLLLGLSQLGLTLWAFIFVVFMLLVLHRPQALLPILAALLGTVAALALALSLSVPPPTPAISFTDHFLYPFQLFSAYWGFGPSNPGWNDGLSLQLGLAAVGLTILALVLWQRHRQVSRADRRLIFFLTAAIIVTLLQFSLTTFLWKIPIWPGYTLASTLTYPWQLLGLAGLCLAILAGAALWLDERLTDLPLFGAIIILIILSSYTYLSPQFIQPAPYFDQKPQAQLGEAQVTLLAHDFSVLISGHTAGLERGQTAIPLAIHGPLQANDVLLVNVVWHPLQTFTQDLKVFVHLVDSNDKVVAQFDGQPQSGDHPTSAWIPGELIEDSYPILFPADAPPGPYRVFLGLYDEATLARLPVSTDTEGRIILNVE